MSCIIGIDTGGTCTDAVIFDTESKKAICRGKAATTHGNLTVGIAAALDTVPEDLLEKADCICLSTTLATNACVEHKGRGARLVLIGIPRKVLEWTDVEKSYGVNPADILCIDSADGIKEAADRYGEFFLQTDALCVSEADALKNGAAGEKAAVSYLKERFSKPVIGATEIAFELNAVERGVTALLNAKLIPVISDFRQAITEVLEKKGISPKQLVVRSDGSLMSGSFAAEHPVETILSGPAASVIGAMSLSGAENCMIVDMGGTTTDVSLVENGVPVTSGGIRIGGWRTQVNGVYTDTFGLGGDSRIVLSHGRPVLSERRAEPICSAAAKYPELKTELEKLLKSGKLRGGILHEALCLVKKPENLSLYSDADRRIIALLENGPVLLSDERINVYTLDTARLEDEGVILRCGLTPTDIMHIKGDFCMYDAEASRLAVKYLLKCMPDADDSDEAVQRFCDNIYQAVCRKLYVNLVRILLEQRFPGISCGEDSDLYRVIEDSFENDNDTLLNISLSTGLMVVGIGAPAHLFVKTAAQKLGAEYCLPDFAPVANAVGAAAADINGRVKYEIKTLCGETAKYCLELPDGCEYFDDNEQATEKAVSSAKEAVQRIVKERGAVGCTEPEIKITPLTASDGYGGEIDLGTVVEVFARGSLMS